MAEIIIVPTIFISFYLIIELFVHRKERLMIIEKATANPSFEGNDILKKAPVPSFSGLKLGCLISGLGLGFLTSALLNICFHVTIYEYQSWWYSRSIDIACILLFGGLGLIVAYLIERRTQKPKA
ncbi:MAG: hypothetical protein LBS12_02795 [Prevotellaceae bacterium]|jgi:hypothetical protein|nr:hypothetical protein [Prevotellaceae bacterium]